MSCNKKFKKNSARSFPYVNFVDCEELELKLIDWLGNDRLLNETMGLLVLRLNILKEEENIIEFCCYNKEDNSFKCIINEKDIYYIRIDNLDNDKDKEIVVRDNLVEYTYKCEKVKNIELDMRIVLSSYKKDYVGGTVTLTQYLSRDYAMFEIDYMDYYLRFKVVRPNSVKLPMFDDDGLYSRYRLYNEDELILYLVELVSMVDLIDVYKNICDISLEDICVYPEIYLDMSYGKDRDIIYLIHLRYGELERFGITNMDRCESLFLNKDDCWEYRCFKDSMIKFSMMCDNDKIDYNISVDKEGNINSLVDMINNNRSDAKSLKEEVKILSRKVVNMK